MAVVVVAEIEGGSQELYEQVASRAGTDTLPEGGKAHIAGPTEGGWRVITVWETEDDFHRFRQEKLIPALQEAGAPVAPNISVNEVHKLITE